MTLTCYCGMVHYGLANRDSIVCACGRQLTGMFGVKEQRKDEYEYRAELIKTAITRSLLSKFSSEELLDEVKRRIEETNGNA